MKANLLIYPLSLVLLSSCSSAYLAQNGEYDGVYDPGGDVVDVYAYAEPEPESQDPADFDYVDPNCDPNQANPYEYSSRIRRFHSDSDFGYYDPYHTNMGWYDPSPGNFGTSLYSDAWNTGNWNGWNNNGWNNSGWNSSLGWNSWSGWNVGLGYSWGWGGMNGAYGPMFGYNPWYGPGFGFNPWNPWSPWNCPGYYNSFDVMSQVVYAPRGQNRPTVGYTQNAYEGALKRGTIEAPVAEDLVASAERASNHTPRTVKNDRPNNVVSQRNTSRMNELEVVSNREFTKTNVDRIEMRETQARGNQYYRQMEQFRSGVNPSEGRGTQTERSEMPRFLRNFESFVQEAQKGARGDVNRGWTPTLNQNQGQNFNRGNTSPSWNRGSNSGSTPSFNRGSSSPSFNFGGGSRGGSSGGSRGGSSGGGSRGGSRGGGRR